MKHRSLANKLRVSYHRKENLSKKDFKMVDSFKLLRKVYWKIRNSDELNVSQGFYATFFNNKLDVVGYRKISKMECIVSLSGY